MSTTPEKVTLYRQYVLEASTTLSTILQNGAFIQWSVDNVDHNLGTLDGKGTFYGMGIVVVVLPSGCFSQLIQITKLKKKKPIAEIVKDRGVPIYNYDGPATLESFPKISPLKTRKSEIELTLIWSHRYSGIQAGIFLLQ